MSVGVDLGIGLTLESLPLDSSAMLSFGTRSNGLDRRNDSSLNEIMFGVAQHALSSVGSHGRSFLEQDCKEGERIANGNSGYQRNQFDSTYVLEAPLEWF